MEHGGLGGYDCDLHYLKFIILLGIFNFLSYRLPVEIMRPDQLSFKALLEFHGRFPPFSTGPRRGRIFFSTILKTKKNTYNPSLDYS